MYFRRCDGHYREKKIWSKKQNHNPFKKVSKKHFSKKSGLKKHNSEKSLDLEKSVSQISSRVRPSVGWSWLKKNRFQSLCYVGMKV